MSKFSFNNRSICDEVNNENAILKGVSFTQDRFGNEEHAVFLSGHEFSYVSLGSYSALKPVNGSISLWVKIEHSVWSVADK